MSSQYAPSVDSGTDQRDPDALREEITRTREDIGETLDDLTGKPDGKVQAKARVDQAKTQAQTMVRQAKDQAQAAYRQQPKAVIAGAGALLALLAALLVRRARQ